MSEAFLNAILTPLVLKSGIICLGNQFFLHAVFAFVLPDGPWTKLPSFTAQKVISLLLMIYISYEGFRIWFWELPATTSTEERIINVFDSGVQLGEVVFGFILLWDIPVRLATMSLHDNLMMVHHFGMLYIAGVVMGIFSNNEPRGTYYAPFFLGVIECSSIFLCYVDVFHPKYEHWYDFMKDLQGTVFGNVLSTLNEFCRVSFALSFLAFRFIYFPYVTFTSCLYDFWVVASKTSDVALYGVCMLNFLFSLLQLYWGQLVLKQLLKALGISSNSSKKNQ
jgi:hypothetical protein